jgi:Rrf2 family transcriptional regulator, nitric oxide-sensitive transcriptional repressor
MFSQTAEYALRVIVHLASLQDAPTTTRQIAATTKIPEGYLAKVLQSLVHAGLVSSQRGLHGGFVLGKAPATLSLYDVMSAVDTPARIHSCPLQLGTHGKELCALHRRLDNVLMTVENTLRQATIAEIIGDCHCCKPLAEVAAPAVVMVGAAEAAPSDTTGVA